MKKLNLSLFLSVGTIFFTLGQTSFPPAYQIFSDTATHEILLPDSNWQMMADPSGKLTLSQVLQSVNFQDTGRKINYHTLTYWLRCRYINKTQQSLNITFFARATAQTDIYLSIDGGSWQHLKSGIRVPWSERNGLKRIFAITTTIPVGKEMTVYERNQFDYAFYIPPQQKKMGFHFTSNVIKQYYTSNNEYANDILQSALITGILLLAVIINFFFFGVVKEREYLYFALFLLVSLLFGPVSDLKDFILKDNPAILLYIVSACKVCYLFFFISFIRYFLKTFRAFPKWDTYLFVLSISTVIVLFVAIFGSSVLHTNLSKLSDYLYYGVQIVMSLSVLATCFLYVLGKDSSAWVMTIAVIPFIVFNISFFTAHIVTMSFYDHRHVSAFIRALFAHGNSIMATCYFWMVIIFSWLLIRRFSMIRKKLAKHELEKERERSAFIEQQKIELEKQVAERTSDLKQSLENLKSTQAQLIQSEKMASLGELTAGIAHEIQNPLNFVNNFSDINKELLEELKGEADNGNIEEVKSIATDVIANEEKINHHGKRADAIVKGMLQHSRTSTGQKEPTDINALCDEYLRLAYHGMRAKDKSFNCELKTEFDSSLPKISVVPQDMGRVLLNLINNAFFATNEKFKKNISGYQPTVIVTTKILGDKVEISVKDNGNGIPEKIKDKIFQPFFTTKPTGQGTGLGLSLSYDIVKVHGGEIKLNSKESEGTAFIIQLPKN